MRALWIVSLVACLAVCAAGCLKLNRDTGYVEVAPPAFTQQAWEDSGEALDATVPDWLIALGAVGVPALGSLGLMWKRLAAAGAGAKQLGSIGGALVENIQLIRQKAAAGSLTLDDINALLTEAQRRAPEVVDFVKKVKAERHMSPVEPALGT